MNDVARHSLIGIDEVGRGCLAGPLLVVASRAVGDLPEGLRDSKLMTRSQRESIFQLLTSNIHHLSSTIQFGEGWVTPAEIDKYSLAGALRLGVKRALADIKAVADEEIVLDGNVNYCPAKFINARCQVGADKTLPLVSAASIYAKVSRDRLMIALKGQYPDYGFERHVGYCTKLHLENLRRLGPIKDLHRFSFAPLKELEVLR